jgi:hypothetical protein
MQPCEDYVELVLDDGTMLTVRCLGEHTNGRHVVAREFDGVRVVFSWEI